MHSLYYDPSCTLIVVKFYKSWIYGESTELKVGVPNKVSVKGNYVFFITLKCMSIKEKFTSQYSTALQDFSA